MDIDIRKEWLELIQTRRDYSTLPDGAAMWSETQNSLRSTLEMCSVRANAAVESKVQVIDHGTMKGPNHRLRISGRHD